MLRWPVSVCNPGIHSGIHTGWCRGTSTMSSPQWPVAGIGAGGFGHSSTLTSVMVLCSAQPLRDFATSSASTNGRHRWQERAMMKPGENGVPFPLKRSAQFCTYLTAGPSIRLCSIEAGMIDDDDGPATNVRKDAGIGTTIVRGARPCDASALCAPPTHPHGPGLACIYLHACVLCPAIVIVSRSS